MPIVTRRRTLQAAAAIGMLPRIAIGQSDTRPAVTVAVQRIATSNTLDIVNEASNVGTRHFNMYGEPLIATDWTGDLSLHPGLAESWQRIDDDTLDLTLRRGVRFHNGDEMTADDVVYTFTERLFGTAAEQADPGHMPRDPKWAPPKVRAGAANAYPAIGRIEALDRYRVRWTNRHPDVALEGRISMRAGSIFSARDCRAAASYFDWARRPVGTGPYRVAEYLPENRLVLEAFDEYWGGRPPIRTLRLVEVPELSSRINGLLTGEFDFACDISPDQIGEIDRNPRTQVVGGIIPNQRVMMLDTNHPQLRDARVRQALSHAIDRQAIIDGIWAGRTEPSHGLQFPFYGPMFLQDWAVPAYDPALARDLLKQAGYAGAPIPYRLVNDYYTNQVSTAQAVIEMWKQVGLNVDLQLRENWSQVLDRKDRAIVDNSFSAFFNDPVSFMPASFGAKGDERLGGYWTNAEVEDGLARLEIETDMERRRALFRRILQIIERDDPAVLHLHETANFTGKRRNIDWKPAKSFVMEFRRSNFGIRPA